MLEHVAAPDDGLDAEDMALLRREIDGFETGIPPVDLAALSRNVAPLGALVVVSPETIQRPNLPDISRRVLLSLGSVIKKALR